MEYLRNMKEYLDFLYKLDSRASKEQPDFMRVYKAPKISSWKSGLSYEKRKPMFVVSNTISAVPIRSSMSYDPTYIEKDIKMSDWICIDEHDYIYISYLDNIKGSNEDDLEFAVSAYDIESISAPDNIFSIKVDFDNYINQYRIIVSSTSDNDSRISFAFMIHELRLGSDNEGKDEEECKDQ